MVGGVSSLASVQSSQQSEPECEGRGAMLPPSPVCLTPLLTVAGVCQGPLPLAGPVWPPSPLTLGAGARAGAGLNWPLCPLRWTQIRGPAQRTDRQYNTI